MKWAKNAIVTAIWNIRLSEREFNNLPEIFSEDSQFLKL